MPGCLSSRAHVDRARLGRLMILACLTWLSPQVAWAQGKTDVVVLASGDRVTCEVEQLERGKLTVKTDSMGTLQIEWADVQQVTSSARFEVELETGERYIGTIAPAAGADQLTVVGAQVETALERRSVVRITEIGEGFWRQIDGSMDVGFTFTKANDSRQWSFAGEAVRRGERVETRVTFNSLFTAQEGIENTSRHTLGIQVSRFLPGRWLAAAVAQVQRNDELDLDFRSIIGGGAGRFLVQSNRTILSVLGGVVFNRERFSGPDPAANNAEAFAAIQFQRFTFDDPETDISATLLVLPNLTQAGRIRLELEARVRREILKDFYWNISFFESYDNEPLAAAAERHDYGLISSFGWSF